MCSTGSVLSVIIRLERWKRRRCLSWHCYVTRSLPLRGLSFVLPVCRRRIISREMVILDTLKQNDLHAWLVIPAWTIPAALSRSFWRSRGIDVLVNWLLCFILNKSCVLGLHVRRWEGIFSFKPAVGKLIKQIIPLNNYNYLESNLWQQ